MSEDTITKSDFSGQDLLDYLNENFSEGFSARLTSDKIIITAPESEEKLISKELERLGLLGLYLEGKRYPHSYEHREKNEIRLGEKQLDYAKDKITGADRSEKCNELDICESLNRFFIDTEFHIGSGPTPKSENGRMYFDFFCDYGLLWGFDGVTSTYGALSVTGESYNIYYSTEEGEKIQSMVPYGMGSCLGYTRKGDVNSYAVFSFYMQKGLLKEANSYLHDKSLGIDRSGKENIFDLIDEIGKRKRPPSERGECYYSIGKEDGCYIIYDHGCHMKVNTVISEELVPDLIKYYRDNGADRKQGNTIYHLQDALNKDLNLLSIDEKTGNLMIANGFITESCLKNLGFEKKEGENSQYKTCFTIPKEKIDDACAKIKKGEVEYTEKYYVEWLEWRDFKVFGGIEVAGIDEKEDCLKFRKESGRIRGKMNEIKFDKDLLKFGIVKLNDYEYAIPRSQIKDLVTRMQSDEGKNTFAWVHTHKNDAMVDRVRYAKNRTKNRAKDFVKAVREGKSR